jgi:shikimate kinase
MLYFIIGFKNSGKTTLGKKLASKLKTVFIDLDHYIEKMEGRTVPDIFVQDGEQEFRNKEWKALKDIVTRYSDAIVSTGGGAPCHCDNMNIMKQYGKIIFLNVPDDVLISRLSKVAGDRPIVKGKTVEELKVYVAEQKKACEPFYYQADLIVEGRIIRVEDVVRKITG